MVIMECSEIVVKLFNFSENFRCTGVEMKMTSMKAADLFLNNERKVVP